MHHIKRNLHHLLLTIFILSGTGLQAAILDDLFESIDHQTVHKKHHRSRHRKHRYHTISDEKKWQTALKFLGYYQGKINGDLLTTESYEAIKQFQERQQYFATGLLEKESKEYLSKVYNTIALKNYLDYEGKNRKMNRKKLQAALAAEGVYQGKIDGVVGKKSEESILSYKKSLDQNMTSTSLSEEEEVHLIDEAKTIVGKQLANFKKETSFSANEKTDGSEDEMAQTLEDKSSMAAILDTEETESKPDEAPSLSPH